MPTGIPSSLLDNLVATFSNQNDEFQNVLGRLITLGHKLSDTNSPTSETINDRKVEPLPFENGTLKSFYTNLTQEGFLIQQFRITVDKLESLV